MTDLVEQARAFFEGGKGILAADESVATATKRLSAQGVASTPENRRRYRELFLGAEGIERYLSGVILFSETLEQKGDDGIPFPEMLTKRGIAPGIKVDLGTEPLSNGSKETLTQGLLDLPERLIEYKRLGATFTKWRAVIRIDGDQLPSATALRENMKRLAQYAKAVQEAGLVPIVEPEVLLEGSHSRARARAVIIDTMGTLFSTIAEHAVDKASIIVKTSMALSGSESGRRDTPDEVAEDTLAALTESVPRQVAGIVFLSGGQTPDQATDNFTAIVRRAARDNSPWPLTFSFARALQQEALMLWKGKDENLPAARAAFIDRLDRVSEPLRG